MSSNVAATMRASESILLLMGRTTGRGRKKRRHKHDWRWKGGRVVDGVFQKGPKKACQTCPAEKEVAR